MPRGGWGWGGGCIPVKLLAGAAACMVGSEAEHWMLVQQADGTHTGVPGVTRSGFTI